MPFLVTIEPGEMQLPVNTSTLLQVFFSSRCPVFSVFFRQVYKAVAASFSVTFITFLDHYEHDVIDDWHFIRHIQLWTATSSRTTKEMPQGMVGVLQQSASCIGDSCNFLQAVRLGHWLYQCSLKWESTLFVLRVSSMATNCKQQVTYLAVRWKILQNAPQHWDQLNYACRFTNYYTITCIMQVYFCRFISNTVRLWHGTLNLF